MVIYLLIKNKYFLKIGLLILVIAFIIGGNYLFNYFKYNNKDEVNVAVLQDELTILRNEIKDLESVKNFDSDYVIARVILRDIHSFYNEVVINVGSNKVEVGDPVVNEEGLIGIIDKVHKDTANVKLLTSEMNISVKVDETYGNLKGQKVDLLDKYSELKVGDVIVTSGLTQIPEGLYVGKIKKVKMDENNLGQELEVELVNNDDLIYVGVIKTIK